MIANNNLSNKTLRGQNYELFEGYSDELLTFASAACIVFIIVGVPGNLLTIIALSRGKQVRAFSTYIAFTSQIHLFIYQESEKFPYYFLRTEIF